MSFSNFCSELVNKIYKDDTQSQDYYLKFISAARQVPIEYLKSIGAFFVPNNDYLFYYGGNASLKYEYDIYRDGSCVWTHFLVIPVKTLSGKIVGFVGWDAYNSLKQQEGIPDLTTYRTTSKTVFNKNNYFLTDPLVLKNTFNTKSIFVVDGVFDSITLNSREIPTISLLGSYPSSLHYYFLQWYEHIYVLTDNDNAGSFLYKNIHRAIPRTVKLIQSETKDIDDFFKLHPNYAENKLKEILSNPVYYNTDISTKKYKL